MFTGLVQELGSLASVRPVDGGARLAFRAPGTAAELSVGDSVAVSGACLTAVEVSDEGFVVDAVAETLRRTTLGALTGGDVVNIEPAMRLGDRLGGHIVQGHVDAVARVLDAREEGESVVLLLGPPEALGRYVVVKGSVALDGVSLTVSAVVEGGFEVTLIPHTMEVTTLGPERMGQDLNLEVDALAKYVEALVAPHIDPDRGT
ncbi:MAG: riboflavin synthase [Miltoncostaeaceae bacterium]